jgi:hypothetical protein
MSELLDTVLSAEPETVEPEPVVEPEPAPEPEPETPEPEPAPEPSPEPQPEEPEARHVPLSVFLDARDREKELKRRVAELEAQSAPQAPPEDMPDPIDDPRGFAAWQTQQVEQRIVAERFTMSDIMAKQVHGEEAVKTAAEWAFEKAKADPAFHLAYMRQPHPLDWIVREHKRQGLVSEIGDNVDDWFAREAAKRGYVQGAPVAAAPAPAVVTPQQAARPAPPRSIASDAPASAPTAPPTSGFLTFLDR